MLLVDWLRVTGCGLRVCEKIWRITPALRRRGVHAGFISEYLLINIANADIKKSITIASFQRVLKPRNLA